METEMKSRTGSEKRDDIYSPSRIVPDDFEYVGVGAEPVENPAGEKDFYGEWAQISKHMSDTGGEMVGDEMHCTVCGHCLLYFSVFYHAQSNTYITVGFDCTEKLWSGHELAFKIIKEGRKEALLMKAGKAKACALLTQAGIPEIWDIYKTDAESEYYQFGKIQGIVATVVRYGNLSDKQVEYLKVLANQLADAPALAAKRAAERNAAEDCPEGRIVINGLVVKTKWYDNDFGGRLAMTVKDKRGFLVWGTVPSKIDTVEKGDTVEFTAMVEQSDKDTKFGFYKRPTKARITKWVMLPNDGPQKMGRI